MSKLMWILGASAGAVVLVGLGSRQDTPSGGEPEPGGGEPEPGGDGGPESGGGGEPEPGSGEGPDPEPTKPGTDAPPPVWTPTPYAEYERGPYTIDLTGLATGVRWRVYATAAKPQTEAAKDLIKFGANVEVSDEEARVAANAFVDALGVLPVEPYPVPPKPVPDPPEGMESQGSSEPPKTASPLQSSGGGGGGGSATLVIHETKVQAHGLEISDDCHQLEVDDIVAWVAWAEPWIRARVASTPRGELVLGLLEESFPECTWDLNHVSVQGGRPLLDTLAEVDAKYFAKARAGETWSEASALEPLPLERAVAELVGGVVPAIVPPEFAYRGYHVEVDKAGAGWHWRAWWRGKSEGEPDFAGTASGSWSDAVLELRSAIVSP